MTLILSLLEGGQVDHVADDVRTTRDQRERLPCQLPTSMGRWAYSVRASVAPSGSEVTFYRLSNSSVCPPSVHLCPQLFRLCLSHLTNENLAGFAPILPCFRHVQKSLKPGLARRKGFSMFGSNYPNKHIHIVHSSCSGPAVVPS